MVVVMAELLKDKISQKNINKLAVLLTEHSVDFDAYAFESAIFNEQWPDLSLKQRIRKVSFELHHALSLPFGKAINLFLQVEKSFNGLFHLVFSDYVEVFGLEHLQVSMQALSVFTINSSAEFAIRPFLEQYPEQTKQQMLIWANNENEHLRRLASEGVRPNLPWAKKLHWISEEPEWIRPIIEVLQSDESRYVQKSVANLVNDLSKTQADWVLKLCNGLNQNNPNTRWIIKHALRTLLKAGNPKALAIIGYSDIDSVELQNVRIDEKVSLGQRLHGEFILNANQALGLIRVEYAISFLRKQKKPYRKVFKIGESELQVNSRHYRFNHDFKRISTRIYIPGLHKFELILNGKTIYIQDFTLLDSDTFSK